MKKWNIKIFVLIIILLACNNNKSSLYIHYFLQFEESIQILNQKNINIYSEFNYLMFDNPAKTGPWNKRVQILKKNKDSINSFIETILSNLDTSLIKKILNNENVKQNQLNKKVKLKNSEIDSLINHLINYRNAIVSLIDDKEKYSELIKSIFLDLSTDNLRNIKIYKPNSVSFSEMLACLGKLKADITIAETDILGYLYSQVDYSGGFRFWKTEALVVPNSQILPLGIQYKAEVFLAKIDTTITPVYEIDNQIFKAPSCKGYYSHKIIEKPGKYAISGNYILTNGETLKIPFKIEYEVMEKE